MARSILAEPDMLRLILGYQDVWFAHFPSLSRRAEWHILNHLGTKGRGGAAAGELYGLVKQAFLLDDSTVKERLLSLSQMALCQLDAPGQVFSRTVAVPTPGFLAKFDAHLRDFAHLLTEVTGNAPSEPADTPAWRAEVQRPLRVYQDHFQAAADAVLNGMRLSQARRGDAKRHLISPSHWNLMHGALRWHYESGDAAGILADRLAARLLEVTGQTVQTTKDHIGYLIKIGMFQRMKGKALHVGLSQAAVEHLGAALRQAAADLSTAVPPAARRPAVFVTDDAIERTLNVRPTAEPEHVLEIVAPASAARRLAVRPPMTLGRVPPCELVLPAADVSRAHCRLDSNGERLVVVDLNSTNGTFVNDRRIAEPTELASGDRLCVGSFRLLYQQQEATVERTQRGRT